MANLSVGIVGLPNVGKSTLFNALTANQVEASNYPFCTIDPNVGVVPVPDSRLERLAAISKSEKILPATMEFYDIAGLVKGASQGEGLGNKFLANIRETDAIVHVVRCFENDDVVHVAGAVDPVSDIEIINLELGLADLQMIENSLVKVERRAKSDKELRPVLELLQRVKAHLDDNKPVRTMDLTPYEWEMLKPYPLLTGKRVLYVANVSEDDLGGPDNEFVKKVREYAEKEGSEVITISAKVESEIIQLPQEERADFLEALGLEEPGLNRLIRRSFEMLGLISYLTTGPKETRAWTIVKGTPAPEAAGKIHSDIQQGFIRAEVVSYDEMDRAGGWTEAREAGKARVEGKEYVVQDGDVVLFRHN